MVAAALASMQRIASDVNGPSVAIDDVNRRQSHFESVLRVGGRIAVPKVECGEHKTDGSGYKQNVGHTWR